MGHRGRVPRNPGHDLRMSVIPGCPHILVMMNVDTALLYERKSGFTLSRAEGRMGNQRERQEFKVSVKNLTGWASLSAVPQDHDTTYHTAWEQLQSDLGVQVKGLIVEET